MADIDEQETQDVQDTTQQDLNDEVLEDVSGGVSHTIIKLPFPGDGDGCFPPYVPPDILM